MRHTARSANELSGANLIRRTKKMKPIYENGELRVELHKPDVAVLEKAWDIAQALIAMGQPTGAPLVAALADILQPETETD